MFKVRIILVSLLLFATLFFSRHILLNAGLKYYLEKQSKELGTPLTFTKSHSSPNSLALFNPIIELEGSKVEAEKLIFEYDFKLFARHIDLKVRLEHPHVCLRHGQEELQKVLDRWFEGSSFFHVAGEVECEEGTLCLDDFEDAPSLNFSLKHSWGKNQEGLYHLSFGNLNDASHLRLSFIAEDPTNFHVQASLFQVDVKQLSSALKPLVKELGEWDFQEGILNGEFAMTLANGKLSTGHGELKVRDLKADHPHLGLTASIEEALFQMDSLNANAFFELIKGGTLSFRDEESYAHFSSFTGTISITDSENLTLNLKGLWEDSDTPMKTELKGRSKLSDWTDLALKISLVPLQGPANTSFIAIEAKNENDKTFADIILHRFGPKQFLFWQRALENLFPGYNPISYHSGTLNALLKVSFLENSIQALTIENIEAENAFVVVKPWEVALGADKLQGVLSVDLESPSPKDSLNADLQISNGQLALIGLNFDFWNFTNIETNLSVKSGVIQKSSASVELAGLKGSAEINFLNEEELVKLKLNGKAENLKPFLPERVQLGIDKMSDQELFVQASIAQMSQGLNVAGHLEVKNDDIPQSSPLYFGFDLERSLFDVNPHSQNFLSYWQDIAPAISEKIALPSLKTLSSLESRWIVQEFGIQGFVMRDGWFHVQNLNLDKFISPFLFDAEKLQLKGTSDISGSFDQQGLYFQYDGYDLVLENEKLSIDISEISSTTGDLPASHYFDFVRGKHFGQLLIKKGSYFNKNNGLLFTDLNAHVIFEGEKVHILDVETYSNGIFFAGNIDINYGLPEKAAYELQIYVDNLHGKFSELQHFISHFDNSFAFLSLPLEGNVSLKGSGAHFNLLFNQAGWKFKSRYAGTLTDGTLLSNTYDLSTKELEFDFAFDSEANTLDLSHIQGTLLLGSPLEAEEYSISGERIHFKDYRQNLADFDLWIGDRNRDLIRIAGKTIENQDSKKIVFAFDRSLTHFGDIHPQKMELVLHNWNKLESAELEFQLRLNTLLGDLKKLTKTGLFSAAISKELMATKQAQGTFDASLKYSGESDAFDFNLSGQDATFGQHSCKIFLLTGSKRGKIWSIDQMQLDEISIAAELTREESLWKANFLGFRYGKSLLVGLEGEYQEGESTITSRINLMEVHLPMLKEWPALASVADQYALEGLLRATGQLRLHLPSQGEKWRFDANLDMATHSLRVDGFNFTDCSHINCHIASDEVISLREVPVTLNLPEAAQVAPTFFIHALDYDLAAHQLFIEGLNFNIPVENLKCFTDSLKTSFPNFITEGVASVLQDLKKTEVLKGILHWKGTPNHQLYLQFEDGIYHYLGKDHDLTAFTLDLNPEELKLATKYRLNDHLFWITSRSEASRLDRGSILLADDTTDLSPDFTPLLISWRRSQERGLFIETAKGYFGGMQVDLAENPLNPTDHSALRLTGDIFFIQENFRYLLEEEIAQPLFNWEIGKGYALHGDFEIGKMVDREKDLRFFGVLSGEDFEMKGYKFKHLTSHVVYGPQVIQISDISITDPAGALYIGQLNIAKNIDNQFQLSIPLLTIQELRPSLLVELGVEPSRLKKPLVIRELYVQNFSGILGDESSFKGNGNLGFINPVKKHLQNTIFAIPAEILTRIGLDLSVLTPVTGTIQYDIHNGKVFLTKFKDTYSHSRLSKFYLPHENSYLDFEGNLNIQVRMKQHTLLFKLAEMLTVTIKGNLKKPTYTLHKQKPLQRTEVVSTEI